MLYVWDVFRWCGCDEELGGVEHANMWKNDVPNPFYRKLRTEWAVSAPSTLWMEILSERDEEWLKLEFVEKFFICHQIKYIFFSEWRKNLVSTHSYDAEYRQASQNSLGYGMWALHYFWHVLPHITSTMTKSVKIKFWKFFKQRMMKMKETSIDFSSTFLATKFLS